MVAKTKMLRMPRQRLRGHDRCLHLRLLSFVVVGVLMEQHIGHDKPEHRVAQELQRLVVSNPA
jgi:hypothetical protein